MGCRLRSGNHSFISSCSFVSFVDTSVCFRGHLADWRFGGSIGGQRRADMAEASGDPYEKVSIPLPATHGWRCKPGNNYFCADRGAVAFEMPAKWVVRHDDKDALTIHD